MNTHRDFFAAFLRGLDLPVREAGLRALAAVSLFESPQGSLRWNNPLACTLVVTGSVDLYPDYTGPCAQRYRSFDDGVAASVLLWSGPHWAGVRAAHAKYRWRVPILTAWTRAYMKAPAGTPIDQKVLYNGWLDYRPQFSYSTRVLDTRLDQQLLGP